MEVYARVNSRFWTRADFWLANVAAAKYVDVGWSCSRLMQLIGAVVVCVEFCIYPTATRIAKIDYHGYSQS